MTAEVIDLAAARAQRSQRAADKAACIAQAQPQARAPSGVSVLLARAASEQQVKPDPPVLETPPPASPRLEPLDWRISRAGNLWTREGDLHVVIFPDRDNPELWRVRIQRREGPGRYPRRTWTSAAAAQEAIDRAWAGEPQSNSISETDL